MFRGTDRADRSPRLMRRVAVVITTVTLALSASSIAHAGSALTAHPYTHPAGQGQNGNNRGHDENNRGQGEENYGQNDPLPSLHLSWVAAS